MNRGAGGPARSAAPVSTSGCTPSLLRILSFHSTPCPFPPPALRPAHEAWSAATPDHPSLLCPKLPALGSESLGSPSNPCRSPVGCSVCALTLSTCHSFIPSSILSQDSHHHQLYVIPFFNFPWGTYDWLKSPFVCICFYRVCVPDSGISPMTAGAVAVSVGRCCGVSCSGAQ